MEEYVIFWGFLSNLWFERFLKAFEGLGPFGFTGQAVVRDLLQKQEVILGFRVFRVLGSTVEGLVLSAQACGAEGV